jgi:hypothetical protein
VCVCVLNGEKVTFVERVCRIVMCVYSYPSIHSFSRASAPPPPSLLLA